MEFDKEWRCCSMHDVAGRRGIWYRRLESGELEVVAGREGDDARCVIPPPLASELMECLDYGAWMQEDYGPDDLVRRCKSEDEVIENVLEQIDQFWVHERGPVFGGDRRTHYGIKKEDLVVLADAYRQLRDREAKGTK